VNNELQARFYNSIEKEVDGFQLITSDAVHRDIHNGEVFTVSKTFVGVANSAYARIRIKASATKSTHFVASVVVEGKCYLKTYVNSTYTDNGTAFTPFNRNTSSSKTYGGNVYHTPTVNVLGSLRADDLTNGGIGPQSAGASVLGALETVLKPGDDILIELQNVSGQAKDLNIIVNLYEE
jgi:hypothetical protein